MLLVVVALALMTLHSVMRSFSGLLGVFRYVRVMVVDACCFFVGCVDLFVVGCVGLFGL